MLERFVALAIGLASWDLYPSPPPWQMAQPMLNRAGIAVLLAPSPKVNEVSDSVLTISAGRSCDRISLTLWVSRCSSTLGLGRLKSPLSKPFAVLTFAFADPLIPLVAPGAVRKNLARLRKIFAFSG